MIIKFFYDLQRKLRSLLSFPFNSNEDLKISDLQLINELQKKALVLVNNSKKNYKETHKIFSSETLKLILDKKLENFLKNSFIQKMFFVHNRYFLKSYLDEMRMTTNWKYWRNILIENNIGSPIRYFLEPFTSGNKIFQTFHLKKYQDFSEINLNDHEIILEFGGGYGNMASIFKKKINKKCKYIIFDTPEVNLLQFYYLKRNNISVSLNKVVSNNNVILLSSYKHLEVLLKKLKSKKKLFIANWSLSETPLQFRKKFKFIFSDFDFQLISFQSQFEDINNLKYFKKLNNYNLKLKRNSTIVPVKKLSSNFYLFSKI